MAKVYGLRKKKEKEKFSFLIRTSSHWDDSKEDEPFIGLCNQLMNDIYKMTS